MKTYEQLADELLIKQKKEKAKRARRQGIFVSICSLCLVFSMLTLPLLQGGVSRYTVQQYTPGDMTVKAENYQELYKTLEDLQPKKPGFFDRLDNFFAKNATDMESAPAPDSNAGDGGNSTTPDFSDTNLQEVGVDEADIIKTDGEYIYALNDLGVSIVKATEGALTLVSRIAFEGEKNGYPLEMFLHGDRLVVLCRLYKDMDKTDLPKDLPEMMPMDMAYSYYGYDNSCIQAVIYDIAERKTPVLVNTFMQDGNYQSSRMIGDDLIILTHQSVGVLDKEDKSTYVPSYKLGETTLFFPTEDIYISKRTEGVSYHQSYLNLCSVDVSGDVSVNSQVAVYGTSDTIYASHESIYVTGYTHINDGKIAMNATKIYRFSLEDGDVALAAEGCVPGGVLNQFSMDEHDGALRIATTVYPYAVNGHQNENAMLSQESNALYVLDKDLKIIGKLEGMAPGEIIYSVRFEGEIGYVVTFKQVDPLFTIDLSDKTKPKVLSELKIPGFSDYLHVYKDALLFGLGMDADPKTGRTDCLKLSMFDVADPYDVSEKHVMLVEGQYYSPASYNHKAILVNSQKNIIAFAGYADYTDVVYNIYSYDEETGFAQEEKIIVDTTFSAYASFGAEQVRGMFIGDCFYIITPCGILSYDMATFDVTDTLIF